MTPKTLAEFRAWQLNEEFRFILAAIKATKGNVSQAARALDVTVQYLQRRLVQLGLTERLAKVRERYGYIPRSPGPRAPRRPPS